MAMSGEKSNIPVLGIIRRIGARMGFVTLSSSNVSVFGLGENHDNMALRKTAMVSTWQTKAIKLNR